MSEQHVSVGRIVSYILSAEDDKQINRRRTSCKSIAERMKSFAWPIGAQAHIGNLVHAGDSFPLVVIRVYDFEGKETVNGQVLLDGNDTHWVTGISEGSIRGSWNWPTRV